MTDISKYLDFVLAFFAFGICFEVPIFAIVLAWVGLTKPATPAENRPYVIVGVFVIAMFLIPLAAISQTLLAIPMWMQFVLGLLFSHIYKPNSDLMPALSLDAVENQEN